MSLTIEWVNLSKTFDSFIAVNNFNIKIEGAKCVGFLGPNGSGKTTTLKMCTGLMNPSAGDVLINGINVQKEKKKALCSIGSAVEIPEIYPYLTPREALMMIAKIRGISPNSCTKKIIQVLQEVQMIDWIDKRIGKFSRGMKQRIVIASALINNPDILLFDEPTQGLDPRGMNEIREIIKSLKTKGKLILMSSHLLDEVSQVCDEVIMIDHGKILDYDSITNIIKKFAGKNNWVEIGFENPLSNSMKTNLIRELPKLITLEWIDDRNVKMQYQGGFEISSKILKKIVEMNLGIINYRPAWRELEDVYMNLIKTKV